MDFTAEHAESDLRTRAQPVATAPREIAQQIGQLLARAASTHLPRMAALQAELAALHLEHCVLEPVHVALHQLNDALEALTFEPFAPLSLLDTLSLSTRRRSGQQKFVVQFARITAALQALRANVRAFGAAHHPRQAAARPLLVELHMERQCIGRICERITPLLAELGHPRKVPVLLRPFVAQAVRRLETLHLVAAQAGEVHRIAGAMLKGRAHLLERLEVELDTCDTAWNEQLSRLARAAQEAPNGLIDVERARQAHARLRHLVVETLSAARKLEAAQPLLAQMVGALGEPLRGR